MAQITNVWIYKNAKGEIYTVRVVKGNSVTEFPVSNSSERFIKAKMRDLFGKCAFSIVEIMP